MGNRNLPTNEPVEKVPFKVPTYQASFKAINRARCLSMMAKRDKSRQSGLESHSSLFLLASLKLCRFRKELKTAFLGVFLQPQRAREERGFRVSLDAFVSNFTSEFPRQTAIVTQELHKLAVKKCLSQALADIPLL